MFNRREWLRGVGILAAVGAAQGVDSISVAQEKGETPVQHHSLDLSDFAPKSMLQVHESHVLILPRGMDGQQITLRESWRSKVCGARYGGRVTSDRTPMDR